SGQPASQTGNIFQVTRWFDQDDPSRLGDIEMLPLILIRYPLQICPKPIAIEVATVGGTTVLPTENNFLVYDPTQGFACVNAQQIRRCQDYKVRFTCPMRFCQCTRWFDYDNPDGGGDSELLADLLNIYPGQICPNPIDIDVEPVSGIPSNKTFFYIVYNSTTGFECINSNQRGVCDDYKVRFTCPEEWCSSKCQY
uniref:WxxW domain-containing protein n=1 Tax=Cyprinus carpio TaxID=7962 RepID=A0A8C1G585_CYPCA